MRQQQQNQSFFMWPSFGAKTYFQSQSCLSKLLKSKSKWFMNFWIFIFNWFNQDIFRPLVMNLSTHPILNEDQLSKKDFLQYSLRRHDQLVRFFVCECHNLQKKQLSKNVINLVIGLIFTQFFATAAWKSFAFPSICLLKRIVGSRSFISLRRFSKVNSTKQFHFAIKTFK